MNFIVYELTTKSVNPESEKAEYAIGNSTIEVNTNDLIKAIDSRSGELNPRPITLVDSDSDSRVSVEERTFGYLVFPGVIGFINDNGLPETPEVVEMENAVERLPFGSNLVNAVKPMLEIGDLWFQAQKVAPEEAEQEAIALKSEIDDHMEKGANLVFAKVQNDPLCPADIESFIDLITHITAQKYYFRASVRLKLHALEEEAAIKICQNYNALAFEHDF